MRIRDISPENRPRERFVSKGPDSLSDAELLAIILQKGSSEYNVIDMCNTLLSKYGLATLPNISKQQLEKIPGIGPAKAMQIMSIFEISKRYAKAAKSKGKMMIKSSKDAYSLMVDEVSSRMQEHFYCLYLDSDNCLIDRPELLFKGILDETIVHPREIFQKALEKYAKSIVLIHNHPSGDPNPSEADITVTKQVLEAARILNIRLQDHIIISRDLFYSFRNANQL